MGDLLTLLKVDRKSLSYHTIEVFAIQERWGCQLQDGLIRDWHYEALGGGDQPNHPCGTMISQGGKG